MGENVKILPNKSEGIRVVEHVDTKRSLLNIGDNQADVTISRRLCIQSKDGEYSLNMALVVEDFRVGFYLTTFLTIIVGMILTKAFTEEDYESIITGVYGISNTCVYFDFAPSTYVLPVIWCFAVIFAFLYAITAIFRIRIAYLEKKLSRCSSILLIVAYIYVGLSVILFMQATAVQPDPSKPHTMIVHTVSYLNWKIMFCVLQVAVVYFGLNVSWKGLNLPRWFTIASVVHVVALVITKIISFVWILNALADMGEGLEGKGYWWSVRSEASKVSGQIFVNGGGVVLGLVLPLFQALFICRNGVNTHALVVNVSDNRVSAASVVCTEMS